MMGELKCKVCGYITTEKKLGKLCPACGVPRTAFEPYKEKISEKRKFLLGLKLHPIMVHFPQAFAAVIPPFIILTFFIWPVAAFDLLITVKVLAIFMPLTVLAAIICGLIDGRVRFKKLSTPLLKKKIIIGSLLFIFSIGLALGALTNTTSLEGRLCLLVFSLACIACEIILAQMGKTMMNAKLPG
jgi:rubredoxin